MEEMVMWTKRLGFSLCAIFPLLCAALQAASFVSVNDIAGAQVFDDCLISDDGRTIVTGTGSNFPTHVYRDGSSTLVGADTAFLGDITPDGSVFVGATGSNYTDITAFRWQSGVRQAISAPAGYSWTRATGVSSDGSVVVGSTFGGNSPAQAFRWHNGAIQLLGTLPGQITSSAKGVSADGSTVVGDCGLDSAFVWRDNVMTGIAANPAMGYIQATGISADGSVAFGYDHSGSKPSQEAFRWKDGVKQGLGMNDGYTLSGVVSSNFDGSLMVGYQGYQVDYGTYVGLDFRAAIWDQANGFRDLKSVLENDYSLDLTGWTLIQAAGMSDDGKMVYGFGYNNGDYGVWMATIPEPATVSILALGLAFIRRRMA
jgi:probable HAF family extracellular repeat protein